MELLVEDTVTCIRFEDGRKLQVDFVHDRSRYHLALRGKNELIARAIGLSKPLNYVFDATLGLAQDAWTLARLGTKVVGCERHPMLFEVVRSGLGRALHDKYLHRVAERIRVVGAESYEYLSAISKDDRPDVIYLDPMFPESSKTALPKIEMQLMRRLLGQPSEEGIHRLLDLSLSVAGKRVVVKRPLSAQPLAANVSHQFKGKAVRFDMYIAKGFL